MAIPYYHHEANQSLTASRRQAAARGSASTLSARFHLS